MDPLTLIATADGKIVTSDSIIYFLTPCCGASATGTVGGVACRGCYNPIDPDYGMASSVGVELDDLTMMVAWLYDASKITDKIQDDAGLAMAKARAYRDNPPKAVR